MDGDILEARHKTIIEQLPSWCLKLATEEQPVTVGLEKIRDDKKRVSFNCRCGRVRVEHRCKNNDPVAVGMALARKCEERHGACWLIPQDGETSLSPDASVLQPPPKIRKSESRALTLANRNLEVAMTELEQLRAQLVRKSEELRVLKTNDTKQDNRRNKEIDTSNETMFAESQKGKDLALAVTHQKLGLVSAVQYWADGSCVKRDQIIVALIKKMQCR